MLRNRPKCKTKLKGPQPNVDVHGHAYMHAGGIAVSSSLLCKGVLITVIFLNIEQVKYSSWLSETC